MAREQASAPLTVQDYLSPVENQWCPGCGNFGILSAVKKALVELQLEPHRLLFVSGIGQAGKFPHYLKCNLLNELHGRTLPAAAAAHIVNPALTVIAEGGDGDGYGEGGNHFIAAMVRNVDLTYLVHNNQVYGLTKGQASPTSDRGFVTKTTPSGAGEPLNPLALAIASNASFVARGFAGDPDRLSRMIVMALQHRGFALVDILQPCVSFNHVNTYEFYSSRIYRLEDEKGYDPSDRVSAFKKSMEWGDRIPVGLFYRCERPLFEETLNLADKSPLVQQKLDPQCIAPLLEDFC
ncbi:MAG: 2-oxoacid:ferredoxin oxidoreductase subunit beta [Dehalococcoidales bacterium]|nr:2-oxoacid:ferredoxin oxidoreductase subunit beta [Dehalococcoidales bacterium]